MLPEHLDFEGQREHLIRILKSYSAKTGSRITIVFDNSQKPANASRPSKNLQLIYGAPGQEADDVIKNLLRSEKHPAAMTIVSSDRAIRFSAKDHGISCLTSEEFCRILYSKTASTRKQRSALTDAPPSSKKYGANISDKEVKFWKDLFEQDPADE